LSVSPKEYDLFISYAGEDEESVVKPLFQRLEPHITVWYAGSSLNWGSSIRKSIDDGLKHCRYGIVILCRSFFNKRWPELELNALIARMTYEDRELILPIWHEIGLEEVLRYSPLLSDMKALSTKDGLDSIAAEILKK
jgi:hypothetical protein